MQHEALQRDARTPFSLALEAKTKDPVRVDVGMEQRRHTLERGRRLQRIGSRELKKELVTLPHRSQLVDVRCAMVVQVISLVRSSPGRFDLKFGAAALVELPRQPNELFVVVAEALVPD